MTQKQQERVSTTTILIFSKQTKIENTTENRYIWREWVTEIVGRTVEMIGNE